LADVALSGRVRAEFDKAAQKTADVANKVAEKTGENLQK